MKNLIFPKVIALFAVFASLAFTGNDLFSQPACKFTFCSCCSREGDSYNIYSVVGSVYTGTVTMLADGCSLDSAVNLQIGMSYYVVDNNPNCDNVQYVYFTACICGNESFMKIMLPCCGGDGDEDKMLNGTPALYKLNQNFPNPFNPSTKIDFEVPSESNVKIAVYDVTGKLVEEILNANVPAGYHSVVWNTSGKNIASGIYFYKLEAGNYSEQRKMVLVK